MRTRTINSATLRSIYLIILVQLIIITFLLAIISNEYLNNYWMQVWIAGKAPILAFLINGQLDALLMGIAAAGTVLFLNNVISQSKTYPQPRKPTVVMDTKELARIEKKVLRKPDKPKENTADDLLRDLEKQEA